MFHLQKWCRSNRVPLIVDVVDWYDGRLVRGGYFGPLHISMKLALRYYYPQCDGIIAISSYLANHYGASGLPLLRVPPTLDVEGLTVKARSETTDPSNLVLIYAGNPHANRKDLLGTVIDACGRAEREGADVELRIYGPRREQLRELIDGRKVPNGVRCLGRVAQPDVAEALQQADFSVLVRRPERAAHAGFSTKFCESLASGTPVIANLTSDMGRYLEHSKEGLVCRDHSVASVTEAILEGARLSPGQRSAMRHAAREQALKSFDYRNYAEPLGKFFSRWP
jgi:glycosyltransferase involved in cell wall biosynthesis